MRPVHLVNWEARTGSAPGLPVDSAPALTAKLETPRLWAVLKMGRYPGQKHTALTRRMRFLVQVARTFPHFRAWMSFIVPAGE